MRNFKKSDKFFFSVKVRQQQPYATGSSVFLNNDLCLQKCSIERYSIGKRRLAALMQVHWSHAFN